MPGIQKIYRKVEEFVDAVKWKIVFALLSWYITSVLLSTFNKYLFGKHKNETHKDLANNPLLVTSFHTFVHFIICGFILSDAYEIVLAKIYSCCSYSRIEGNKKLKIPNLPTARDYFRNYAPCAFLTAIDIGLSNFSMRFISLSIYVMIKSSAPIFVVLVAWYLGLEKINRRIIVVIFVMCIGMVLMSFRDDEVDKNASSNDPNGEDFYTGFFLVLFASVISAIRWGLTQILLKKNDSEHMKSSQDSLELNSVLRSENHTDTLNGVESPHIRPIIFESGKNPQVPIEEERNISHVKPIDNQKHPTFLYIMFLLSPLMSLVLLIFSLIVEQPFNTEFGSSFSHTLVQIVISCLGGVIAFSMVASEYWLITLTGILFLSVSGILKEVLTLIFAAIVFGDRYNAYNFSGLILSICAIIYFNYIKFTKE